MARTGSEVRKRARTGWVNSLFPMSTDGIICLTLSGIRDSAKGLTYGKPTLLQRQSPPLFHKAQQQFSTNIHTHIHPPRTTQVGL